MAEFSLEVVNKLGEILFKTSGENEITMAYRGIYNRGDKIVLKSNEKNIYIVVRLEDSLEDSFIYLKDYKAEFEIPFGINRKPYGLKSFIEGRHWSYVRVARKYEVECYKNLAKNTFDSEENRSMYPHAETNVTTEDPVFFAKNAIDGIFETCNHGSWPHSSWGINKQKDAYLKIDFGREVIIDNVALYLRADFPHDNWWKEADIYFSDKTVEHVLLKKTGKRQEFNFSKRRVSYIKLQNLIMSEEKSEFPALSQIEVYGKEAL